MPTALDITIVETLALLDGDFAEFAAGIAHDQYAIWLGAGVSLGKLPGLEGVAGEVLEHLRIRIDSTNAACKFRRSLDRILNLILSPEDWKEIDYAKSATDWKIFGRIKKNLTGAYSRMLDQHPQGELPDYLVWDAVKVVERYGDPSITPGPEHFGLAALIAEGVASDVASANWDALIEKAIVAIAGSPVGLLQVRILPEDVRDSSARARFYKFHGCAVLGGEDEARYRERIVGRASQIHGWADKAENKVIAGKLLDLAISKSTLMLGLSAQDTNIQNIFVVAQQSLPASFPTHPPAVVLSENSVGADQLSLLQNFYKTDYVAKSEEIEKSALLRAYSRSLLPALWLHVVCSKLETFLEGSASGLTAAEKSRLRSALRTLRNGVAATALPDQYEQFMVTALSLAGRAMNFFRDGRRINAAAGLYSPLSMSSVPKSLHEPGFSSSGIQELALGIALVALAATEGFWECRVSGLSDPGGGALRLAGAVRSAEVFFAANNQSASRLIAGGYAAEDSDTIILHSHEAPARAARHPTSPPGRTLRRRRREISLSRLSGASNSLDEILKNLRAEIAV
ncbi:MULTISPECIES: SIR2 family protein [Bradyrhizobium]|uniref:SIR2-like domain-containing protein n=2 Tax=Bradyrhizobium TaxID=374 RepID=A0A809Z1B2_9BRAD|nr:MULTISPECIES: SIR2 family protein [Bradyrhizobium]AJA67148.1 hypothetical protein RN69_39895 [Bradyrhizobium japonicum]KGT76979.1 hypothetical protein MA20_25640 [Bradyrhizobium japonicum]MBP1089579.1 hypothetical protein [Bradyrhizobium japonicum]MCD9297368.1 SIR2 family protein [Bradyrhizobium diazoefficiens]MCD9814736.1 SIR2 family protein [Bradyrhizobium diazoefficiens]